MKKQGSVCRERGELGRNVTLGGQEGVDKSTERYNIR